MTSLEYIQTTDGKKQLIYNNYLLSATTNKYLDGSTTWKCVIK